MTDIYEQVRAAWGTGDRRRELNRTVERLAPDVTRDELDAALEKLLLEVRAVGADEETEEVINEVSDRLHDWVVPESRIACRPTPGGYTVTFPDRDTERRGLGFLVGRFSGQVRSSGVHVIPRDALAALADQNIPFTFVGTADGSP